jgi:hypothetical protein
MYIYIYTFIYIYNNKKRDVVLKKFYITFDIIYIYIYIYIYTRKERLHLPCVRRTCAMDVRDLRQTSDGPGEGKDIHLNRWNRF